MTWLCGFFSPASSHNVRQDMEMSQGEWLTYRECVRAIRVDGVMVLFVEGDNVWG